jgi:hypothetical protein
MGIAMDEYEISLIGVFVLNTNFNQIFGDICITKIVQ